MAEPDRVYYYVVSDFYIENHGPATIKINPLDSDQAQLLMSKFAFSTSKAKK